MRVLAVIPARGGSKGLPRKNIRPLLGKPLLCYTAAAAQGSRLISKIILSTEDDEIAQVGRDAGLEVPFLRPAELAQDRSPTLPVVQHAVAMLEARGERYDVICLLEPTNPLRRSATIDACLELLNSSGADAVATVLPVPAEHNPHWVYFRDSDGWMRLSTGEGAPIPRRQELPPAYHRDGSVYATRRDVLMNQNSLYGRKLAGFTVRPEESMNIDGAADWQRAEELLAQREGNGQMAETAVSQTR
jgi:CMP-N,N'-diacetyllegionaminic acid synthase